MYTYPKDKVKGALYGIAIGDAMGATTEFFPQHSIKKQYKKRTDIIGKGWLNLLPGEVTDPTELAFCVCDALAKTASVRSTSGYRKAFLNQCCQNYADWYDSHPFDIERCIVNAIEHCRNENYQKWALFSTVPDNNDSSVLFAVAPAILTRHSIQLVMELGSLTHNNSICNNGIRKFRQILIACLRDMEVTSQVFSQLPRRHRDIDCNIDSALYHLETTATFETAILEAVYHGGDTDAIAALTGCLAGASYGYSTIPQRWISQLMPSVREKLDICVDSVIGLHNSSSDASSCA
ncbi:MAG: hypothetical protein E7289_05815 [Lachnospiraceae bacterium]|nr:hypothetical protein [Lachnospiraceae bacterium]